MENIRNSCYDRFYEVVIPIVIYERNTLHDCFALLFRQCLSGIRFGIICVKDRISYLHAEINCKYQKVENLYQRCYCSQGNL